MIKKALLFLSLSVLVANADTNTTFTDNEFYAGFGWKTFQMGSTNSGKTIVNGNTVRLNAGYFIPTQNIKIEFTGSVFGSLGYKIYNNGVPQENDPEVAITDYTLSAVYGLGKRTRSFDAFPYLIGGLGYKTINHDTQEYNMPLALLGVGFSIRTNHIEFFAKFSGSFLSNTPTFLLTNGDTIDVKNYTGSLEVGYNYVF